MTLDLQYKINSNPMYIKFLREYSYWYKFLNRDPDNFNKFIIDMKDKYKLNPTDRLNKMLDNINMLQSFLDVLR